MVEEGYCNQGKLREKEEKNKHRMIKANPQKPTKEKYSTTQGKQEGEEGVERVSTKETSNHKGNHHTYELIIINIGDIKDI